MKAIGSLAQTLEGFNLDGKLLNWGRSGCMSAQISTFKVLIQDLTYVGLGWSVRTLSNHFSLELTEDVGDWPKMVGRHLRSSDMWRGAPDG